MIRIGLLDTSVPNSLGSMPRYRDQLIHSLQRSFGDQLQVATEYLGCCDEVMQRVPRRLRMWRRHHFIWSAAKKLDPSRYDLVHVLDGSFAYVAKAMKNSRVVTTVHDIIPRLQADGVFPDAPRVGRGARWLVEQSFRGLRSSDRVCCDSQSTADDLQTYQCVASSVVRVIPLAIESELFSGPALPPQAVDQPQPFVFHLGNNGFYKNRAGAIEVIKRIDPLLNCRLVLAGPEPDSALCHLRDASGVADRIHFVTDPDQSRLAKYYRAASVFLFPSLYEGFGWPPLEAMAAGCPVVSSDAGSLAEVVGRAGVVTASGDYEAMARGCERLIRDQEFRQKMITSGLCHVEHFSRQRLAENMFDVYQEVAGRAR